MRMKSAPAFKVAWAIKHPTIFFVLMNNSPVNTARRKTMTRRKYSLDSIWFLWINVNRIA